MSETDDKKSHTISLSVDEVDNLNAGETCSTTRHIHGFPWTLTATNFSNNCFGVSLQCDKGAESELWWCDASLEFSYQDYRREHVFCSWDSISHVYREFEIYELWEDFPVAIKISLKSGEDGDSFLVRPTVEMTDVLDGILVVEEKKIHVNKKFLAAHSSYFNALFFGGYKESKQEKIEIKDVEFENLKTLLQCVNGTLPQAITKETSEDCVELSRRFDLKIVEEKVINFIIAHDEISIYHKLIMLNKIGPESVKLCPLLLHMDRFYVADNMREMRDSEEFDELPAKTLRKIISTFGTVLEKENECM